MPITLEKAMKLAGVETWTLTPSQQKFLIVSTEHLLQRHPEEWFLQKQNQNRFKVELKQVFNEL
jgi:hypothetical protein